MAAAIPESQLADAVGPQGMPKAYAIILAALSLILVSRSLSGAREKEEGGGEETRPSRSTRPHVRAAGLLAIGIVYLAVVPWLGYLPSIAGLILATTYYQGGFRLKPEATIRQIVLVAVSGAVLFWLLFVLLLRIPHPPGVWSTLF